LPTIYRFLAVDNVYWLKGYIIGMKDLTVGAVEILHIFDIPAGPFTDEALDSGEFPAGDAVKLSDNRVTSSQGKRQSPS